MYNYNARLYDPVIGMFVTPDSIVPSLFDPQTLNRYCYCRNNPLGYIDPSGHSFFGVEFVIGAVIGAIVSGAQSDWNPEAMLVGAVIGGISAGVFAEVGGAVQTYVTQIGTSGAAMGPPTSAGWAVAGDIAGPIAGGVASGATSGGLNAAYSGGDIGQGALMGAAYGAASGAASVLLKAGWQYARNKTNLSSIRQWDAPATIEEKNRIYTGKNGKPPFGPRTNSVGELMTAGVRRVLHKSKSLLQFALMNPEGSDSNRIFGIGYQADTIHGHMINRISKVHDFFNSWRYAGGRYMPGGMLFDTAFDVYSFVGMPVAGALTIPAYYGSLGVAPASYYMATEN